MFPYAAQNEGELSVDRGEVVDVLEKPDPQWWRVQSVAGALGMLPATYLEDYVEGQAPLVGKICENVKQGISCVCVYGIQSYLKWSSLLML